MVKSVFYGVWMISVRKIIPELLVAAFLIVWESREGHDSHGHGKKEDV